MRSRPACVKPDCIRSVRRKHAMEAGQVHPCLRHQSCQSGNEVQWLEDDVRCTVTVRRLQVVPDVAVRREQQALLRNGRAADVATQPLELLALVHPRRHTGVQREPGQTCRPRASNGSSQAGSVCSVNTLRPCWRFHTTLGSHARWRRK